jgi:hypothetical protein
VVIAVQSNIWVLQDIFTKAFEAIAAAETISARDGRTTAGAFVPTDQKA